MTIKPVGAALAVVVLGTVIAYGWGPSSAQAQTSGVLIMLVGTASLAGVLVRSLLGLRRTTRARRPEAASSLVAERIGSPPAPVEISAGHGGPAQRPSAGGDLQPAAGAARVALRTDHTLLG